MSTQWNRQYSRYVFSKVIECLEKNIPKQVRLNYDTIHHNPPRPTTIQNISTTTHNHPPPSTTTHQQPKYVHHQPPSTSTHHQPKYVHRHPPPPTTSQNISTTTHHHPKLIHHYLPFPKKWTTTPQKSKYILIWPPLDIALTVCFSSKCNIPFRDGDFVW